MKKNYFISSLLCVLLSTLAINASAEVAKQSATVTKTGSTTATISAQKTTTTAPMVNTQATTTKATEQKAVTTTATEQKPVAAVEQKAKDVEHNDAHEHGVAQLNLAIQDSNVSVEIDGAYQGFLGFEHKPNTTKQKLAYENLVNTFNKKADEVFSFGKKADCKVASVNLKNDGMPTSDNHENFHCELKFVCKNPVYLKNLKVNLFKYFNGLHTVRTQIAANNTQKSEVLSAKKDTLKW